jgi:hypothetical protein
MRIGIPADEAGHRDIAGTDLAHDILEDAERDDDWERAGG